MALALVLGLSAVGTAQSDEEPVVTPAVQVTTDTNPTRAHNQPQVLVHPDDDQTLAVVEAEFLSSTCFVHISRDGGTTWAESASRPMPPEYPACARPAFGCSPPRRPSPRCRCARWWRSPPTGAGPGASRWT